MRFAETKTESMSYPQQVMTDIPPKIWFIESNNLCQNLTEYDDLFAAQYGIMEFMRLRDEEIEKQTKTCTIARKKADHSKKTYYKILRCVREVES